MKLFDRNLRSNTRLGIWALTAFLLAGGLAQAHSNKPKASPSPGASPSAPQFNVPIPVDHNAKGVDLPFFDNGKLQMYFVIRRAYRLDTGHLDMFHAFLQTYDDKETPDIAIYMNRCLLDLNTRIITSQVPVTVRRADFEITGQQMVFNTRTHVGRLTGHVRMIIYNLQSATGTATPSPTPPTRPAPKPSAKP